MAKKSKERKGYFYEEQEEAVVNYLKAEDVEEKSKIFNKTLKPAFTKMIESIIRRYKLFVPDEEFNQTFDDTLSFLMTNIEKFKPEKGYKAYSYCGTICKNYLILKINKFVKAQNDSVPYGDVKLSIEDSMEYSYEYTSVEEGVFKMLINEIMNELKKMLTNKGDLTKIEVKVGESLIKLLENWDEIFVDDGSNKFNKSSILLYLKEDTRLSTADIRKGMAKYKDVYKNTKDKVFNTYL